jgi:outer membrane protein assembly factor BamB
MRRAGSRLLPSTLAAALLTGCWLTYHLDSSRSGADFLEPALLPPVHQWTSPVLDEFVYAEPLALGNRIYVATENNTLYALDLDDGHVVWQTHVGPPVPRSSLPCGNIDPLGITGTPVVALDRGLIYAVAELNTPTIHHQLVGFDLRSGAIVVSRSADPAGMVPIAQQQRAALALSKGRVYVSYGGLNGDCGAYHGWVVGASTDGSGPLLDYQVPTTREGGIWAPSGPMVDRKGNLFVATGNGESVDVFDHGNAVVKLSPELQELDFFAPVEWAEWNRLDLDLGSTGPVLLPSGLVFQIGKQHIAYLLDANHLGGIGGEVASLDVGCAAFGGDAVAGNLVYVPCSSGIRAVRIAPDRSMSIAWQGPAGSAGSPIVAGGAVWVVDYDGGLLYALDPVTGAQRRRMDVGHARHFTSPTTAGGHVIVATDRTVQSFVAAR